MQNAIWIFTRKSKIKKSICCFILAGTSAQKDLRSQQISKLYWRFIRSFPKERNHWGYFFWAAILCIRFHHVVNDLNIHSSCVYSQPTLWRTSPQFVSRGVTSVLKLKVRLLFLKFGITCRDIRSKISFKLQAGSKWAENFRTVMRLLSSNLYEFNMVLFISRSCQSLYPFCYYKSAT